jgi:hypothetical protein
MSSRTVSSYADPVNTLEIMAKLETAPTLREVMDIVEETFPGWVVSFMSGYSADYPSLTHNWHTICDDKNIAPSQVMIVDDLCFEDTHSLIKHLGELFTMCGFVVRRKRDLIPCETCGLAIPVRFLYDKMKESGKSTPDEWSMTCVGC